MKKFKVVYKKEIAFPNKNYSDSIVEIDDYSGFFKYKDRYVDCGGNLAIEQTRYILTEECVCNAVSKEAVLDKFKEFSYDDYGYTYRSNFDVSVSLLEDMDENPFEKLDAWYCMIGRSKELNREKVGLEYVELDIQQEYKLLKTLEEKEKLDE